MVGKQYLRVDLAASWNAGRMQALLDQVAAPSAVRAAGVTFAHHLSFYALHIVCIQTVLHSACLNETWPMAP